MTTPKKAVPEDLRQEIAELEAKERALREALAAVTQSLRAKKLERVERMYGVKIGIVVKDGKGVLYEVKAIRAMHGADVKPWLIGSKAKKNGGFSLSEQNLYDSWELVTPAPENPEEAKP